MANNNTTERQEHKQNGKGNFKLVLTFLQGSKRYFAASMAGLLLMSFFDLVNPKIISFTVDSIIGDKKPDLTGIPGMILQKAGGIETLRDNLWLIACAVIIVALLSGLTRYIYKYMNTRGAEKLVKRMRDLLFDHIIHLPFAWFSENHTGDIIQRCTSDVDTVKRFLSDQLTHLFRIIVLVILALYFMAGIHPRLTLVSAAFFPVIIIYSIMFHTKIGSAFEEADNEEGKLSAIAQENLTGVRVVRAFGRESYERERFEKQNEYYTGKWIRMMQILASFWTSNDFLSGFQVMIVVVLGAVWCVQGQMTAGNYIAFISYNAMLTWPVRMLGRIIAQLSQANVSITRIAAILNAPCEKDVPQAQKPPVDRDIVFDHVSYRYENGGGDILKDVSFTVPAGSTVGILGTTGSGKSTLMYLLDRLYPLDGNKEAGRSGRITIGGVDIADVDMHYLRENIGFVLQEPYLFSRKLSENIAISRRETDMKEVRRAAGIASLSEAIDHFKQGYDTYVGERGVTLSGGQVQRTAIAQMLIRKTPVMIFDDSLSAVDAETDAKIRKALREKTDGATVILIAHRITTLMDADKIIVLDHGSVAEEGTHEELIAKKGIYSKVFELQTSNAE